jgi:glycerol-3-phosphate dehydrogenase subunit C
MTEKTKDSEALAKFMDIKPRFMDIKLRFVDIKLRFPDVCVRCANCMTVCPVSRITPAFPGPKQAGPGAQRFRSESEISVDEWITLCTGCRLCDTVCPSGVPISEMNLLAKAKYLNEHGRKFRDWLLASNDLYGGLAAGAAHIINPLMKNASSRKLLDSLLGIDKRAALPAYESRTFMQWFRERPVSSGFFKSMKVAYFHGCFIDTNETDVGKAAVALLEAQGFEVIVPPQNCCGLPRLAIGDLKGAKEMGRRNIASLLPTAREGMDIIFSSTSCGLMLRHDYDTLLNLPGAKEMAAHLFDICEFLLRLYDDKKLKVEFKPAKMKVAYFTPCHLRALNIGLPAVELLRLVPGLEVHIVDADCCGLGGLYGFKKENFSVSEGIGSDMAKAVKLIGPDLVLTDCEGCRMQIRRLTGLPVIHPVQLLRDLLLIV